MRALVGRLAGGHRAGDRLDWPLLYLLYLVPVGVALGYVDCRTRLLPTRIIAPSYLVVGRAGAGLLRDRARRRRPASGRGWAGWSPGFVFWFLWRFTPGMGYGDVRLSGVLGLALGYLGWGELLVGMYAGFLVGAVGWIPLRLLRLTKDRHFPFGPFMLLGAVVGVVWAPRSSPVSARGRAAPAPRRGVKDSAPCCAGSLRASPTDPSLVAILEGLPAHVEVTSDDIADALARRRLGYGRGARMKFEQDEVTLVGGVRHGETQGGPVAIQIGNTEWPKWEKVMSADPVDRAELDALARNAALTRPRPGHADLVGMQKYDFDEARPILERASARETAARVALGRVATQLPRAGRRRPRSSPTWSSSAACPRRTARCPARRRRPPRRRPGALPGPGRVRGDGRPRSTRPTRTATPSAAWSRSSSTGCRRASARTCTGTAGSTRGWPVR